MRRRDFLVHAASFAVLLPQMARAQQNVTIGFLNGGSQLPPALDAFRAGLKEGGFTEGQNAVIEYRWADGNYARLPELAGDLVRRNVNVVVAGGGDLAARAAKAATSTIPIVATSGDDPVVTGLVGSIARPGGNLTGVSFFVVQLHAKRFELMHELVPDGKVAALLTNPASPQTQRVVQAVEEAARARGMRLQVLAAASEAELERAFEGLQPNRPDFLIQQADPFLISKRELVASLANRASIPAIYEGRQFVQAGGLLSYGPNLPGVYRQLGVYAARVLKGEKAGDLPVMQPTKFELVVNQKTAKAIGLKIPEGFLLRADDVIE